MTALPEPRLRDTAGTVQSAFLIVVIAVGAVGVVGALVTLLAGRRTWESYGRDHLLMDSDLRGAGRPTSPAAMTPAALAERDAEIRQMLEARNARRRRRGEAPIDVEAELARLTAAVPTPVDDELRAEIRDLVIARNHRRARRGEPPLDVESEVARQIADLDR